jgi:Flp pilus assembly pilin Flp
MLQLFVVAQIYVQQRIDRVREQGATAVEYAIMAGVICVGIIVSFSTYVRTVERTFNEIPETWPTS